MNPCLELTTSDLCVEVLANSLLLAANFALISNVVSPIHWAQTCSEVP